MNRRTVAVTIVAAGIALGAGAAAQTLDNGEHVTFNAECVIGTAGENGEVNALCVGTMKPQATTTTSEPTTVPSMSAPETTAAPTSTPSTSSPTSTTTTTSEPDTTTTATTTTAPPAGDADFVATFDTPGDFFDRFDRHLMSGANAPIEQDWMADHDTACNPPPSERPIHGDGIHSGQNPDRLFFWCAPGGDPAKGHIMSSLLTGGVADLSFSPRQTFTDPHQVCWDVNTTWLSSRKWVNVLVVPADAVTRNRGRLDFLTANDMGLAANAGLLIDSEAPGTVRVKEFFGHVEVEVHTPGGFSRIFGTFLGDVDKMTRYQHCLTDNGDGTLRIFVDRPDANLCGGPPQIYPCHDINETFPGRFPDGPVRVIFQDALYDAPKGDTFPGIQGNINTWHYDNIIVR